MIIGRWAAGLVTVVAASAAIVSAQASLNTYRWAVPQGFPSPPIPGDNPISDAKVELGRYLFYDTRMSGNRTQSCGTCHQQARAFTDGKPQGVGSTGEKHPRGPMSLVNVAYASTLTWANPVVTRLEEQALVPMYGEHPIELGLSRSDGWLQELTQDARYRQLFTAAFGSDLIDRDRVTKAIATFERTIVSARSPYDRYHFERDEDAVSAAAKRGEVLFHSRPLSCFTCHGGVNLSADMPGRPGGRPEFHNTGLYNVAGLLSYPGHDTGVYEITHDRADVGKFKPPTLRNIAVTAPYMHDGSVATLDEAIDHYAAGGRTIARGPHRVGHDNPNKSESIQGFTLTADQRADLIAFLQSLTDEELLRDARFADPWPAGARRQ
jgi:cytochrome c peroxidase